MLMGDVVVTVIQANLEPLSPSFAATYVMWGRVSNPFRHCVVLSRRRDVVLSGDVLQRCSCWPYMCSLIVKKWLVYFFAVIELCKHLRGYRWQLSLSSGSGYVLLCSGRCWCVERYSVLTLGCSDPHGECGAAARWTLKRAKSIKY